MYKWKCFAFMLLIMSISNAQILNETFGDTSNFTTSHPFFSNGDRAFFGITGNTDDFGGDNTPSGLKPYEEFLGNYLTGMRLNGMGASLPITITWENIAIQNIPNLIFKGDFAEYVDEPGHIDAGDFILVEYQVDANGYQPLLSFVGADFSTNSFNGVFREDTNFDGVGDGQALNYKRQRFTKHIPDTGAVLDLRISVSVNAHEEDFAIDNIILTGDDVVDATPPVILCYNDIEVYTDLDSCGAIVNFSLPNAIDETDTDPIVTQIGGPASGAFFPTGNTELVFEATDSSGNTAQCSIFVFVKDKQSPNVQCAEPILVYAEENSCYTIVHYDLPIVSDNCSNIEDIQIDLISGLGSGGDFLVGVNYETYRITDLAGNISVCSVVIEVLPSMVPKLLCPNETILVRFNNAGHYILPKLEGRFGIELDDYCGQRGVYTEQTPQPGTVFYEGTYEVEIRLFSDDILVDSCTVQLVVQESLGIRENTKLEFVLYPNPVKDRLYIETLEEIKNIQVYTLQGKRLKVFKETPITLSDLPKGVYIVRVEGYHTNSYSTIIKN